MPSTNLAGWLFGSGTKKRELRETRQAWDETQACWRSSPLAKQSLFDLSLGVLQKVADKTDRVPIEPILNAAGQSIEYLLRAEDIGDLEAQWQVIECDMAAAIGFRKMLVRRRRWAVDFDRMYGAFSTITGAAVETFFRSLPESCFRPTNPEASNNFEVPLIDLLDDPVSTIDQLFMLPYRWSSAFWNVSLR